jgi:hypothetical protein
MSEMAPRLVVVGVVSRQKDHPESHTIDSGESEYFLEDYDVQV